MIGQIISHYKILGKIGAGGMGVVYLAEDQLLKRRVAIKMLAKSSTSRHGHLRSRFLREARAISAISHPHIATVYDYGETVDGHPYLVMELLSGRTLSDEIQDRSLTLKRSLQIIDSVATALSVAHGKRIVHRDIKPSNIALSESGEVKVLDFGLAKQIDDDASHDSLEDVNSSTNTQTCEGVILGTPLYLSPEQVQGIGVDARSDIFSLGSLLYQLITGTPAFSGRSAVDIYARVLHDDPPLPSSVNPAISAALDVITLKALAKDREDRYQTAAEFSEDLQQLLSHTVAIGAGNRRSNKQGSFSLEVAPNDESPAQFNTEAGSYTETAEQAVTTATNSPTVTERPADNSDKHRSGWVMLLALSLISILAYASFRSVKDKKPRDITSTLQFQRLVTHSNIKESVISPDGKYIASVVEENGKSSIRLMELATSSDVEILEPTGKNYHGLSFPPDGTYVYYLESGIETDALYRVSKFGDGNRKLIANVNTPVSFSPDGKRMVFVRYDLIDQSTALLLADADGANERQLISRRLPEYYSLSSEEDSVGPVWSPDGNVIVTATVDRSVSPTRMNIQAVTVSDGKERQIGKRPWQFIVKLAWLSNGKGLIVVGSDSLLAPLQLSLLDYSSGEVSKITNDPNSYSTISVATNPNVILALKSEQVSTIWLSSSKNGEAATPIRGTRDQGIAGLAWAPNPFIVYSSIFDNHLNLWITEKDGIAPRQLTFESGSSYQPSISPDRQYVVFVSNRSGLINIWRMNADGSNALQLTRESYADMPQVTPDGRWVLFHSQKSGRDGIWKVPIEGGEPLIVLNQNALYPTVSPNGKVLACLTWEQRPGAAWKLGFYSIVDGTLIRQVDLKGPIEVASNRLSWSSDGLGVAYVGNLNGVSNVWIQPLNGDTSHVLTTFQESQIFDFAWSPDGKELASVRGTRTKSAVVIKGLEW